MTINIEKMRSDMRWETRRFVGSAIVATAAVGAAGAAIGSYLTKLQQPQTTIIQQQPSYAPPVGAPLSPGHPFK